MNRKVFDAVLEVWMWLALIAIFVGLPWWAIAWFWWPYADAWKLPFAVIAVGSSALVFGTIAIGIGNTKPPEEKGEI